MNNEQILKQLKEGWARRLRSDVFQQRQVLIFAVEMWQHVAKETNMEVPELREAIRNLKIAESQLRYLGQVLNGNQDTGAERVEAAEAKPGSDAKSKPSNGRRRSRKRQTIGEAAVSDAPPS